MTLIYCVIQFTVRLKEAEFGERFQMLLIADALGKTIKYIVHHLADFLYQLLDAN